MTKPRSPTSFDLEFGDRLRNGDESALVDLLARLEPVVRHRLRVQFGDILNEHDLDDIVATAVYRLWRYRTHYDPGKSSLGRWFYLIARSVAFDVLRRSTPSRQLTPEQWSGAAESERGEQRISSRTAERIQRLDAALAQLSDTDRRIVLAFASAEGEPHWTDALVEELNMPASTIRSRKHRVMKRLRVVLVSESYDHESE